MPAKVVEASVVASIIFEEPRADEADALIRGDDLYAPTILGYELGNVARKKTVAQPNDWSALHEALNAGLTWQIVEVPVDHLAVLRLALETGLTTYDAAYLWLARAMSVPLVTFDERLARISGA
jgi:predicted nucleic acid-binding protein